MTIVTLSFPETMINEMDKLQKSRGFTGRSELVRAAIRLMVEDMKEKDSQIGNISAMLAVTHKQDYEEPITKLKHTFQDTVKTHVHSKISHADCVELFLLEGDVKKIKSMTKAFQKEEHMKNVRLTVL